MHVIDRIGEAECPGGQQTWQLAGEEGIARARRGVAKSEQDVRDLAVRRRQRKVLPRLCRKAVRFGKAPHRTVERRPRRFPRRLGDEGDRNGFLGRRGRKRGMHGCLDLSVR